MVSAVSMTAVSQNFHLTSSALEVRPLRADRRGDVNAAIQSCGNRDRGEPRARRGDRARARAPELRPGPLCAERRSAAGGCRVFGPSRLHGRGSGRRCDRCGRAGAPREGGARTRRPRPAGEQRVGARDHRAADRLRRAALRPRLSGECRRADCAGSSGGAAAGGTPRADREHHERRGRRRVSRLGAVRRGQGGARASHAHARDRVARTRRVSGARRSRRHADAHASGRLSGRRHHASPAARRVRAVLAVAFRSEYGGGPRRALLRATGGCAMGAAGVVTDFELPAHLEAAEPPEARGLRRDEVRLLVSNVETDSIEHARFSDLPRWLAAGDLLVVNTSGTLNAALPAATDEGTALELHLSTRLPGGFWTVEVRQPGETASRPYHAALAGTTLRLPADGRVTVLAPYPFDDLDSPSRLWMAALQLPSPVEEYLERHGFPIRYGYVPRAWPGSMYQTVFATEPGSAEMPSAGRPFSGELVARLVSRGIQIAPLLLHTGVASQEDHEPPYEEYYRVPRETAERVNGARQSGRRVIAVGTTVVRALETVTDERGFTAPGE